MFMFGLLFLANVHHVKSFQVTRICQVSDNQMDYLISILEHYQNYSFVVHFDHNSSCVANQVLRRLSVNYALVCTYSSDSKDYTDLRRPLGERFVNLVVLTKPFDFKKFITRNYNVLVYDVDVFYIHDMEAVDGFWREQFLKAAGNTIVIYSSEEQHEVYSVCYFCGVNAGKLTLLENTSTLATNLDDKQLFPRKFSQFYRHLFYVGHFEFFPHMYCKNDTPIQVMGQDFFQCVRFDGGEADALDAISKKLNFTFKYIFRGKGARFLDDIKKGIIDFAIGGISVTPERYKYVKYSTYVRIEDFTILYMCRISVWTYLKLFGTPFVAQTWLLICITLIVVSLCLHFSILRRQRYRTTLLMCVRPMIDQSDPQLTTKLFYFRWGPFIIFAALFLVCFEINAAYKSKLSSIFIRPPHKEPTSPEELIDDDYLVVADNENMDFFAEMLSETDPLFVYLRNTGVLINGICGQARYITHHRAAMMNEEAVVQYYIRYMCKEVMFPTEDVGDYRPEKLRITTKPVRSNPHAWVLQPALPIWKSFDRAIGQLINGGFIDKWTRDALMDINSSITIPYSKNNFPEKNEMHVESYTSCLLIYGLGNLLAIAIFLIECATKTFEKEIVHCLDPNIFYH